MLQRFLDSMVIDFYKWHDGEPYDLDALRQLGPGERAAAEKVLLERGCQDWRDVEALNALYTDVAAAALLEALESEKFEVRVTAAELLARRGAITAQDVERILLKTIPRATLFNGLTLTYRLAEQYPTEAVRRALLLTAMDGSDDARVHAAALVEYLYGVSKASFDFDRQHFYLRFREKDRGLRREAFLDLCRNVGVDPKTL